jgi:NADPH2:quinone reductase
MRALVATGVPGEMALQEVPDDKLGPGQVLVEVQAISLNRGEVHRLQTARAGWRPGWDFAGVVADAAPDVTQPTAGDRVFGTIPEGAWGEQVAAPADHLSVLPDALSWAQGAALPVAGLTALRVLELPGRPLRGARVLVLGAAGGVGHLAVQLARRSERW